MQFDLIEIVSAAVAVASVIVAGGMLLFVVFGT
jgi:hypothetical protein